MNTYQVLVGVVLPYVALAAFVAGMVYRFRVWTRTPQPGKMKLFTRSSDTTTKGVLKEALFFRSLFNGDRVLWAFAWIFHVTLALVLLGHLRVVTSLIDRMLHGLGMSHEAIHDMSSMVGGAAGILLLATAALLLLRRIGMQRVREISGTPDFFILLLVIAIIATGNAIRFGNEAESIGVLYACREWIWGVFTFSPAVPEHGMFLSHVLLGQMLIILLPFSKLLHFGGIFFTQALVKRR